MLVETSVVYQIQCAVHNMFFTVYVFNLQYCKQTKDIALFIQEFVFGLSKHQKEKIQDILLSAVMLANLPRLNNFTVLSLTVSSLYLL